MTKLTINPGICGLTSIIYLDTKDLQNVSMHIDSSCPHIMQMAEELLELDGYNECFSKFGESEVFKAAKKFCKHSACPIPTAILKGIEVTCELALPKDVIINIEKE